MPQFTHKDNEQFALSIVKDLRGKVLDKYIGMNDSCNVVCTVGSAIGDAMTDVKYTVLKLIKQVNPDCKVSIDSGKARSEPDGTTLPAQVGTISFRDTSYDEDGDYYGTEVYVSFADTPSGKGVAVISVTLEGE